MTVTRVILIANAGIFLEMDGIRLLVDAFPCAPQYPFSSIRPETFHRMTESQSIYRNVDFVIFSHGHPDHYAPAVLLKYLQTNRVRRVLLPGKTTNTADETELIHYLDERRIPYWRLGLPEGKTHTYQLMPDVYLMVAGMQHTSAMFANSLCDCLMLSVRGYRVLFTSDCSFDDEEDYAMWQGIRPDAVFVNPYFFHAEKGRALLRKWDSPNAVLYHIPYEGEDKIALRTLAHCDFIKYASGFQRLHLLWDVEQELDL